MSGEEAAANLLNTRALVNRADDVRKGGIKLPLRVIN